MLTTGPARADARPEGAAIGKRQSTGGLFGRLPKGVVKDPDVTPELLFLVAYLCRHVAGKEGFGCNHTSMEKEVRGGFSEGVYKRAVKQAKDAGLLHRRQGRKKGRGRDPRGRGYAIDRLTFDPPARDYVMVERGLFNGSLTPKEIACFLYLQAQGGRLAELWQIQKRLRSSRPTVNGILKNLGQRGMVRNYGTRQAPRWGLISLKISTFKNAVFKKAPFKKPTYTRKTYPSHQISPAQVELERHTGTSSVGSEIEQAQTDCGGATGVRQPQPCAQAASKAGLAIVAGGNRLPFSNAVLLQVSALGVDLEALGNRYHEFADKAVAKGQPISDPSAYFLKMAEDAASKSLGISVAALKQVTSPNKWLRGAALARAVGAPPDLPPAYMCARIDARLKTDGLDPEVVKSEWRQARVDGRTKANYCAFADYKRATARRWKGVAASDHHRPSSQRR